MANQEKNPFLKLKEGISKERKFIEEFSKIRENMKSIKNPDEKKMIASHISVMKDYFQKVDSYIKKNLEEIKMRTPLPKTKEVKKEKVSKPKSVVTSPAKKIRHATPKRISGIRYKRDDEVDNLRRITLKRLKKRKVVDEGIKEEKPSKYIHLSNRFFSDFSVRMLEKGNFKKIRKDLMKTNIRMLPKSYISVMLFTTLLSFFVGIFFFTFFLFFNLSPILPIITPMQTELSRRFLQVFWIIPAVPILTFISMYLYPGMEKQSLAGKIDREIPFAAIHMSSISGSMINPSKIFSVIVSTHEYPNIEKEFIKVLNEVNILGYDLVTALRNVAFNSPSKKLSELLNGLAITTTSGGNLPEFFEKRSQSLLFEYRLEREKESKAAETFMDIYISTVIAAPMILMLLLIIMKISGLGIDLSAGMISLIMVLGVSFANFFFLIFLQLKNQAT